MPRRNKGKKQSHQEIIKKRNEKKQKKVSSVKLSSVKSKEYHLKEFLKLSSEEDVTKKDVAMQVMNIVEEVKDEGLNDKRYMDIMNLLMKIHKSEEQINNDTWSERGSYDNIIHNNIIPNRRWAGDIINLISTRAATVRLQAQVDHISRPINEAYHESLANQEATPGPGRNLGNYGYGNRTLNSGHTSPITLDEMERHDDGGDDREARRGRWFVATASSGYV
jgi:hypothetical protein